ncbi:BTAD domain-containing putative transcriptional regulator [Dactylosporangium sp. NPDC051484]|uniref:BTAD domain-containing putative transcriptional regulator n=1 Tax=Dactylosporangium sp. NPDC051484 TaxID=3154942 RepID=UPI00344FB03D
MQVRVLGDLQVLRSGVTLPLGGAKPRTLVGILVAARGRTVTTERLIDQLWGDDPPLKVLTALQAYIAKLRRQLEPDRGPRQQPRVLVTRLSGYTLLVPEAEIDACRFEALVTRAGGTSDAVDAERVLDEALGLWHGRAYAGLTAAPVLAAEAARLEELRLGALEQLWSVRLDRGRHEDAVAALGVLVAEHPSRERLWAILTRALYRCGRQAEALDALRRVRAYLAEELGIDPGAELRGLETAVLRQDDALLTSAGRVSPDADRVRADPPPAEHLPGRANPLALSQRLVTRAARGSGGVLLVTGEPGIGKTRLAEAIAAQASTAGLRTAWGIWEAEGSPPLWGWSRALAAPLSSAVAEDDTASATFRFADHVLGLLAGDPGTCVVLDDVQWADADSLRLLRRLADMVTDVPVLLVVVCRDPGADDSPAANALLAALARLGVERITLSGLAAGDVRALVHERTGLDVGETLAQRIRERTEGNPFYVHELVRLLVEEGALSDAGSPAWRSVPHGVRDTVRHRLSELPADVGHAVLAAAVLGRTVELDVLEECWAGEPAALDVALAAGLMVEHDTGRIGFAHALVRDAVYGELSPLARRRMHARAAAAIERCRVGHLDEHAAALAEHYRLAGPAHARSAWTYAARAARLATAAGAHADAARLLSSAADLLLADGLADAAERGSLFVALGTALRRSGRVAEAWLPLRVAAESALERGDVRAAAGALLAVTENVLWSWRTEHVTDEAAVALWQRVLNAVPAEEIGVRARILAALAVEAMHDPPAGRCAQWADEALTLARRQGDVAVRIDVLQVVLNALRRPDLLPRRVAAADELVELCVKRGDERALAVALCKRALNYSAFGRPDAATADLRRALVLAERHHLATALMVIHLGFAVLRQAQGDWTAAEEALRTAETVQSTISMAGAGIGLSVRATAWYAQGRLVEAEPALRAAEPVHPAMRDLHALSLICGGRAAEARALLGPWREQPEMIWDYLWLSGTVLRALVWAELGDRDAVAALRSQLEPFADRIADGAMAACFLGSVPHALASLALAVGEHEAARRWGRAARALHHRLGWAPWERLSDELLARVPTE